MLQLMITTGFPKTASAFKIASAMVKEPKTKKKAKKNAKKCEQPG